MQNFKRKLSLGGGYMTVDIEVTDNRLSICGETEDSCGQNVGELDEFFKYSATPAEKAIIPKLRDIWNKWHLNDMRPGCEHQRAEWDTSEKVEVITYRLTSDALKDQRGHRKYSNRNLYSGPKNIQQKRKIRDNEIMTSFCGTLKIPSEANDSNLNKKFDKLLISLSKLTGYNKIVREP